MHFWRSGTAFAALAFVATLAAALTACASLPAPRPSHADRDTTLSIVTLNLYHDKADWPKRRMQIIDKLRVLRPDAIALQEVIGHEEVRNQAAFLADALGYQFHFVSTDPVGHPKRYGNALLTRHPILARNEARLRPLDDSRTAAHVRIAVDGRAVNIYATHLHYKEDGGAIRVQQVRDLLSFIADTDGGAPSIVAGDFNATSDTPELALMDARFDSSYDRLRPDANQDQRRHTTLNPHYFPDDQRRIDHIYAQRDAFTPTASTILFDRADASGVWATDHFGVHALLRLRPAKPNDRKRPW